MARNEGKQFVMEQRVRRELVPLSRWRRWLIRRGRKQYLRHERREEWTGELPIYLFWCSRCARYTLDYPHGFIQRRYLLCHRCGDRVDFVPWWVPWRELWDFLKISWRYRDYWRPNR